MIHKDVFYNIWDNSKHSVTRNNIFIKNNFFDGFCDIKI